MQTVIELPNARTFAAALIFVSTEETRYYLHGVHVESAPDGVLMTATDGHRLFHGFQAAPGLRPFHPLLLAPVGKLPARWTSRRGGDTPLTLDPGAGVMRCGEDAIGLRVIDGTFPDYTRILPSEPLTGETAQFNAKYLADFDKAGGILNGDGANGLNYAIGHNGGSPALVRFVNHEDALGVLMPVRSRTDATRRPVLPAPHTAEQINAARAELEATA